MSDKPHIAGTSALIEELKRRGVTFEGVNVVVDECIPADRLIGFWEGLPPVTMYVQLAPKCEHCDGKGWYAHGETDSPQQVQCEACNGAGFHHVAQSVNKWNWRVKEPAQRSDPTLDASEPDQIDMMSEAELRAELRRLVKRMDEIRAGAEADAADLEQMRDGSKATRSGLVSMIVFQQQDIRELKAWKKYAEGLGLRIGLCKSSDCPEGRLAHELAEGSELHRIFNEWSHSIGETEPEAADARADLERMLVDDNKRMRAAGTNLAEAALRVIRTFDGTHRLALAVGEWTKAIADEGNRGAQQKSAPAAERVKRECISIVNGWRENDWPEGFDRSTAVKMSERLAYLIERDVKAPTSPAEEKPVGERGLYVARHLADCGIIRRDQEQRVANIANTYLNPSSPSKDTTRASDAEIRQWAERHDLQGSITDLRATFEDARTLPLSP